MSEMCDCGSYGASSYSHDWDCSIRDHLEFSEFMCNTASGTLHPLPRADGMYEWDFGPRIFGFRSLEDLHRWFDQYMDRLNDLGYEIVTYENVTDVISGVHQIAFIP